MTNSEKVTKFLEYIKNIGGINGDILIIDPYIFCKNADDDYKELLKKILLNSQYNSLKVVTSQKNYCSSFLKKIKSSVGNNIRVFFSDKFHDRFWIANENKGFISGTSLNGVGKRYSIITLMEENDVSEIVKIVHNLF